MVGFCMGAVRLLGWAEHVASRDQSPSVQYAILLAVRSGKNEQLAGFFC